MGTALLIFFLSGAAIVVAGTALARRADVIADHTRLGRLWIGAVLMATATSLPEMATDVAAVRLETPDLAAGDLFGSSLSNMLILAIVDLLPFRQRLLQEAAFDHALAACLAIVLNCLGGVFVLVHSERTWLGLGPESVVIVLVYLAGTRTLYYHSTRQSAEYPATASLPGEADSSRRALRRAIVGFTLVAVVILVAAPAFAWSAKRIAELTGLGATLVGTVLVGISTSLPEFVSTLAAVRLGAFDLAAGNLFGSNAFNMVVFLAMDLAYPAGSIFAALDPAHVVTAIFAIILTSLGLAAIVYRAERRFAMLEPGSILMLLSYLFALWLLYARTGQP